MLHQVGIDAGSVGLSIFIWAAFLKLLTSPLYEKTLKYPAEFEKAVQNVIEAQLKRDNPDAYTFENDQHVDPPQWTNPIKAQLAPIIYKLTAALPLFYIEAESFIQLVQERPEFRQPLLWIPCLDGPSQEIGSLSWLQHHSLAENLPWLFVPALLSATMFASALVKERFSLPDDTDPDSKIKP